MFTRTLSDLIERRGIVAKRMPWWTADGNDDVAGAYA